MDVTKCDYCGLLMKDHHELKPHHVRGEDESEDVGYMLCTVECVGHPKGRVVVATCYTHVEATIVWDA